SDADALDALYRQRDQLTAEKTRQGVVIQHRAWRLPEVFRSDEDYSIGAARPGCVVSRTHN
ncbi:MAG: hypothetical protein M1838_002997, partial [Thelocarpon superellum]